MSDYVTWKQANELAGGNDMLLRFAIGQQHLSPLVMARGWKGVALPDLKGRWDGCVIGSNSDLKTFHYRHDDGFELTVVERRAAQLWYLDPGHDGYELAIIKPNGIDVSFLRPLDGNGMHSSDPKGFPSSDFLFWIRHNEDNRFITVDDLIFKRTEIVEVLADKSRGEDGGLGKRETDSWARIVKTLCAEADIDISEPYKAATVLEQIGAAKGLELPRHRTLGAKLTYVRDVD